MDSEPNGGTSAAVDAEPIDALSCTSESIAMLISALVAVDGIRDGNEMAIAHRACEKFGVAPDEFRLALELVSSDPEAHFRAALEKIVDPTQRE